MTDKRSFWAWGMESREPAAADLQRGARAMSERFGTDLAPGSPPRLSDLRLRAPRVSPPKTLASFCVAETYDRAFHSYGHSFPDRVRKFRGDFSNPPDFVAYPAAEADIEAVLGWCHSNGVAVVPFGGGSSVVGGVEPPVEAPGAVALDLRRLNRVIEVDATSRAARIQAGALGPSIEAQLRPHGLTLRHFPQSFEFSTLGGWIATRSAGHYATNHTHIDEFVESVRMLTPAGTWGSRRLPGGGAGPSPDRFVLGSEGTLGVITEAWMRVQARPRFREAAGAVFPTMERAAEAARRIVQAKLWPANCRVLDAGEAAAAAGLDGSKALLVLGFESAELPQEGSMRDALELALDEGGKVVERTGATPASESGPVEKWRRSFVEMPYVWNTLVGFGLINDTFESAITWDQWPDFDRAVRESVQDALKRVCGGGTLTCRFTHVYPDGPAPYYTFTALGRRGSEIAMWKEIKAAASEALEKAGGTITHHHAVGRDHKSWYQREAPGLFLESLRAAKRRLDPNCVLNPGVLFDP
ncbi:MAG: FAD-binding oxidoreductase [Chloroflexi bacterium]|nr:FAD-binding oxidoreductase [Chloroflexota bacterium]